MKRRSLQRVHVKNYKSLASSVVELEDFTVLIGPNGAGKSNFVDALRFVSECLLTSVTLALQNRGGINAVRRHSRGHPTNFGFRLIIEWEEGNWGEYSFEIAAEPLGRFSVKHERCVVRLGVLGEYRYEVEDGQFIRPVPEIRPRIERDRLALTIISAIEEFRPIYDFLTNMRFYSLAPERIRQLQEPDAGMVLKQDGANAAAVLREVQRQGGDTYERVCRLLSKIVPGTSKAEYHSVGQKETITFKQDVGDIAPWNFNALNMSDGTLRVLGILLAVYQVTPPSLIVIEEPEATIHPAALDVLVDIIIDGATRSQMLVTTHSPDILDNKKIVASQLRLVRAQKGQTQIGPIAESSRHLIRQHLYSVGELLRMGELHPDEPTIGEQAKQLSLFGTPTKAGASDNTNS